MIITNHRAVCFCPECQVPVDPKNLVDTTGKISYHTTVCSDCYENSETDDGGETNE